MNFLLTPKIHKKQSTIDRPEVHGRFTKGTHSVTTTQMHHILGGHSSCWVENRWTGGKGWMQEGLLCADVQVRGHGVLEWGGCGEG